MQEAAKIVSVVMLLTASASLLAQERTVGTGAKPSSRKMMVIDPKDHQQMVKTAKEMDQQLQELKMCVLHERSACNSDESTSAAEQGATDTQIQALQRSVDQLRHQLESSPRYLDQMDPLLP